MKDSITVVATTTLALVEGAGEVTGTFLFDGRRDSSVTLPDSAGSGAA
jgi:hypothetical protein